MKCVKRESCLHCGSNYCRFVDELEQLKQALDEIEEFCIVYSNNHDAYETVYKHILEIINKQRTVNNDSLPTKILQKLC